VADGRVALVGDVPSGLDPFLTDEVKLKQIIINLVGNALKFTTAGTVTVRVVPDAAGRRAVRLDVMDTGIGIAPERLTAIFDAFEQADNETAVKYGGTGLGLSISRAFAALLGYRIVVRSTVGVGSIFSLLLDPIALVPPAPMGGEAGRVAVIDAATSAASEPLAVRALKNLPLVLVIDDSADSRAIVNDALLEANVEVMLATSGDEGLALARAYRPSVILLDLVMPGMTGWEVLGHLKTDPILSAIPVVIVSALAEREDSPFLGALDVVEKPIRRDVLLAAVRRHLAGLTRPHVMIVDDDIDVRNLLTITLREAGPCQIHEAENGVDALLQVERVTPDLFVLDLMMPEMNGFQLLQQLRRDPRFAVTPIIVVSAKDLSAPERALLARDTATLIQKGPDVDRLLQETLQALSRAV
jgi:adenylate cyclase